MALKGVEVGFFFVNLDFVDLNLHKYPKTKKKMKYSMHKVKPQHNSTALRISNQR